MQRRALGGPAPAGEAAVVRAAGRVEEVGVPGPVHREEVALGEGARRDAQSREQCVGVAAAVSRLTRAVPVELELGLGLGLGLGTANPNRG